MKKEPTMITDWLAEHGDPEITKKVEKQLELEEAAEKEFPLIDTEWCRTDACEEENLHLLGHRKSFIKGAKWQAERMYSEEDMQEYAEFCIRCYEKGLPCIIAEDWFNQFKKK